MTQKQLYRIVIPGMCGKTIKMCLNCYKEGAPCWKAKLANELDARYSRANNL